MESFRRCVEDLESIDRLLELPHGRDIALEIFRELQPFLAELGSLKDRDRSGAVSSLFEFAESIRVRVGAVRFVSGPPSASTITDRVA
jgi:hypothetical protein